MCPTHLALLLRRRARELRTYSLTANHSRQIALSQAVLYDTLADVIEANRAKAPAPCCE